MFYYLIIISVIIIAYLAMALTFKESYSKILIFNQITNLVTLSIAMLSTYEYYNSYMDIALIYCLLSFVVMKILLHLEIIKKNER